MQAEPPRPSVVTAPTMSQGSSVAQWKHSYNTGQARWMHFTREQKDHSPPLHRHVGERTEQRGF